MNDLDTEFGLEQSLGKELDSDYEPLNLLVPDANCYVVENPTISEGSTKAKNKFKVKSKERGKERGKGKNMDKIKEKEIKPGRIEFYWVKNMLHMQKKK